MGLVRKRSNYSSAIQILGKNGTVRTPVMLGRSTASMNTLTSSPQDHVLRGRPFWKALAVATVISATAWSAVWFFAGPWTGLQRDDWLFWVIYFLLTVMVINTALYARYVGAATKASRRERICYGILHGCVGAYYTTKGLQGRQQTHDLSLYLVFGLFLVVIAVIDFYRAFKPENTTSTPS